MAKLVPLAKNTEKHCLPRNVCVGRGGRIDANRSKFLLFSFRGKTFYTAYCAKTRLQYIIFITVYNQCLGLFIFSNSSICSFRQILYHFSESPAVRDHTHWSKLYINYLQIVWKKLYHLKSLIQKHNHFWFYLYIIMIQISFAFTIKFSYTPADVEFVNLYFLINPKACSFFL